MLVMSERVAQQGKAGAEWGGGAERGGEIHHS